MIRHIVFLKLSNNSLENKRLIRDRILALKDVIRIIRNLEVGLNFSDESRAYDIALIADFDNKEDLQTYATNETHLGLIQDLKSQNTISKVVDYEF